VRYDADAVRSPWLEFAVAVSPVDIELWKTSNVLSRLYAVFKVSKLSASVSVECIEMMSASEAMTRDGRIDFLPDSGFRYPMPKIRPDLDLAGSDFCCNCNTVGR